LIRSRVAKRYAKALLSLGQEEGRFQEYGRDLDDFSRFFDANQELREILTSPAFVVSDRKKILNGILAKSEYSETVKNFLNLLLDKNRMEAIREVNSYYEKLMDEVSQIARVDVIAPIPLREDAARSLEKALEEMTSKRIRMELKEDKSLIGGLVVKIGDLVLDGSIKAQIEGLKESLGRGE
jgi:F-type H+-transporting ATPase subunit delta